MAHPKGILLLASLAPAAADLPPGLARSFRADVPLFWAGLVNSWMLDLRHPAPRYREINRVSAFYSETAFVFDVLYKNLSAQGAPNVTYGLPDNQACARSQPPIFEPYPNPFVAAFTRPDVNWTPAGNSTDGNCLWWWSEQLRTKLCVAASGAPVKWEDPVLQRELLNVTLGPLSPELFAQTKACDSYPMPHCANRSIVNLTVYRVHDSREPMELDNRDVGDLLGSVPITCNWLETNDTLITSWALTALASWGQYGRCHYRDGKNFCDAQTGNYTGRQSPLGMFGPHQGQCSSNDQQGSWYSLPAGGKCRPGQAVGTGGCTWAARPLKSVHGECITGDGLFRSTCRAAKVAPWRYDPRQGAAIFTRAFASDNRSRGGCPGVTPDPGHASLVVV